MIVKSIIIIHCVFPKEAAQSWAVSRACGQLRGSGLV